MWDLHQNPPRSSNHDDWLDFHQIYLLAKHYYHLVPHFYRAEHYVHQKCQGFRLKS